MIIPEIEKRPNEKFAIGLKYLSPDLGAGATILTCIVTISPEEVGGLTKQGSVDISTDTVSQVVYSGENEKDYNVIFLTTTSEGNIFEDAIYVRVRSI